jgi:hypothetical protein
VVALEQHNYTPSEYHYPLGYPLIGTLFYSWMPQHPFLIPDVCFYVLFCLSFIGICRRAVSFPIALPLCLLGVLFTSNVLGPLVRPWTNIPASTALMILAFLALTPERDRWRSMIAGVCAALIFAVRPGDISFTWPVLAALWLGCHSWREAVERGGWFALGAAPVTAVFSYYSIVVHGQLVSKSYLLANADIVGSGFASWGIKLYTFFCGWIRSFRRAQNPGYRFPAVVPYTARPGGFRQDAALAGARGCIESARNGYLLPRF